MRLRVPVKLTLPVIAVAVLLAGLGGGATLAANQLYKVVAGTGNVTFVDEVTVDDVHLTGPSRVQARLVASGTTIPDQAYTVKVYLDLVESGSTTVTWTAAEIPDGRKVANFTGLSLAVVESVSVEVTR